MRETIEENDERQYANLVMGRDEFSNRCHICGHDAEYICRDCDEYYCDDCGATYNQFTQIDYDCCKSCAGNYKNRD